MLEKRKRKIWLKVLYCIVDVYIIYIFNMINLSFYREEVDNCCVIFCMVFYFVICVKDFKLYIIIVLVNMWVFFFVLLFGILII